MTDWQIIDMKTLPTGVDLLVFFPNIGQAVARYVLDEECDHCTGWYCSIIDEWYREPLADDMKPTHWQHLPEPPK